MGKRYSGVREIVKGKKYEIGFQINGKRKQYRVDAVSEKEAYLKRASDMVEYQKKINSPQNKNHRLDADFTEVWEHLESDLLAETKLIKKTRGRYKNVYWRMFVDFRGKYFPHISNSGQLTLPFFREYRNYYANDLGRQGGIRSELIHVKAIMSRLYLLGYCSKELIEQLKELKKPPPTKKTYPNIGKSNIERLLAHIKQDRPDYYNVIYFMYRAGRRREEVTLIEKRDVVLKGFKPVAINIRAETTKKKVNAPLTYIDEDLEKHIRRALSNNKTKWLFPNRLGNRCTPNRVCDYLKKKGKEIFGVEVTPHYFRHRLCTECGKKNVPIADVKAITGIRDTNVLLEFYSHSTIEGQKQVFEITKE